MVWGEGAVVWGLRVRMGVGGCVSGGRGGVRGLGKGGSGMHSGGCSMTK